ncbi:hypothetical protein [Curtobacterium sp. B18]|uniref:hypothetical protein n=1 Tax=Curtobacterium sp. B18 TaxID=95614 RepID=UPI0011D28A39|nr:hypothetical protein [Curtobacterium sp. B18]
MLAKLPNLHPAYVGVVGGVNWPSIKFLLSRDLVAAAGPDVESAGAGVQIFPVVRLEIDIQKLARRFLEFSRRDCDRREADEAAWSESIPVSAAFTVFGSRPIFRPIALKVMPVSASPESGRSPSGRAAVALAPALGFADASRRCSR